jgi:hypothetical protein
MKKENFYKKLVLGASIVIGVGGIVAGMCISWQTVLIMLSTQLLSTFGVFKWNTLSINTMSNEEINAHVDEILSELNDLLASKKMDMRIVKMATNIPIIGNPIKADDQSIIRAEKRPTGDSRKKNKSKKTIKKTEK